ncbi:MAG: hypothetical protein KC609_04055, partial [Myxococcales bacterium]|nr:hypothetical protein [Myxococcales bacterium]
EAVAARRDALRSRFPRFASRARRMRHVLENWWSELPRGSSPSGFAERVEEVLQCERSCDSLESCCQHRPLSGG